MVEMVLKKPLGLAALMAMLGFIGSVGSFAAVLILSTALLGDGPYTLNGEAVSRGEYLSFLLPFMAMYLPGALLAAACAWLIHRENPISRRLLMAYASLPVLFGPAFVLMGVPPGDALSASLWGILFPVAGWLYLYRKGAVVEYYAVLGLRRTPFPGPE